MKIKIKKYALELSQEEMDRLEEGFFSMMSNFNGKFGSEGIEEFKKEHKELYELYELIKSNRSD